MDFIELQQLTKALNIIEDSSVLNDLEKQIRDEIKKQSKMSFVYDDLINSYHTYTFSGLDRCINCNNWHFSKRSYQYFWKFKRSFDFNYSQTYKEKDEQGNTFICPINHICREAASVDFNVSIHWKRTGYNGLPTREEPIQNETIDNIKDSRYYEDLLKLERVCICNECLCKSEYALRRIIKKHNLSKYLNINVDLDSVLSKYKKKESLDEYFDSIDIYNLYKLDENGEIDDDYDDNHFANEFSIQKDGLEYYGIKYYKEAIDRLYSRNIPMTFSTDFYKSHSYKSNGNCAEAVIIRDVAACVIQSFYRSVYFMEDGDIIYENDIPLIEYDDFHWTDSDTYSDTEDEDEDED